MLSVGKDGVFSARGDASYNIAANDTLSHAEREQIAQNTKISGALDTIRSAELSQSSNFRFEGSDSFGEGMDARFSQTNSLSETEARELSRAERIEDSLSRTSTESGGANADYTQAFTQWFHDTDQGPASMLQPRTAGDVEQLQTLQRQFLNEQVIPTNLGVWITPDLESRYETESNTLEDRANIIGTHNANTAHVPDGDHIEGKMDEGNAKLGRDADTIRNEVAAGQQLASGDVQAHQAEVTGAVEEKQGETKVGRVLGSATEDLIEDPIHLGRELLRQNEEPEQPDDWVFRQQGLSGRRDEAALKPQADSETTPTSTSDGSGAAEHQQRNLWLPKGMGMPQRGNNRRCAINCGVIRRSAGICDPISSRICTASNRSKSGLGLNCRAHQSAVA